MQRGLISGPLPRAGLLATGTAAGPQTCIHPCMTHKVTKLITPRPHDAGDEVKARMTCVNENLTIECLKMVNTLMGGLAWGMARGHVLQTERES